MVVVEDESIFIYDVKVRKVWAIKGSRPRILATGSHRKMCWFGALAEDGTQIFRHYENADSDGFLDFMKHLLRKYPKIVLFIDKATYHKKEKRVKKYFRQNRHCIKVRWFPSENFEKFTFLHKSEFFNLSQAEWFFKLYIYFDFLVFFPYFLFNERSYR